MTPEQVKGMLYGLAVGDALGVPYEFRTRDMFTVDGMVGHGTHDRPAGTWSDDTALTFATLHSLLANDWRVDAADMLDRFRGWLYDGEFTPDGVVFDCGLTCSEAIRSGHGCDGVRDNGNGSLMRIGPLAIRHQTDEAIRTASAVTHAHATSMAACVRLVRLLEDLAAGHRPQVDARPRSMVRSGGYVLDTLDAAVWCFTRSHDYRSAVVMAVELGDDTDTTACVTGAMAGLWYGYDAIPEAWVRALRGKDLLDAYVEATVERL